MALDVSQGSDKNMMILYSIHGEKNQRFRIREHNGKYLMLAFNGGTVEVPKNSQ